MKKSIFLFGIAALTGLILSFTKTENPTIVFGTFGADGMNAPKIELNADHTFHYVDKTQKFSPIDITGTWTIENNEVHLLDVNNRKVMDELSIEREGKCLKARKGMAFYTLCNCN